MLESVCAHCDVTGVGVDCVWNMQSAGGTSGLFAVKIALALGSSKIIICGIPMDGSGHYFDPPDAKKNNTDDFSNKAGFAPWHDVARIQIASDRVRSMSGRTAQLFGKPTKEWVQS